MATAPADRRALQIKIPPGADALTLDIRPAWVTVTEFAPHRRGHAFVYSCGHRYQSAIPRNRRELAEYASEPHLCAPCLQAILDAFNLYRRASELPEEAAGG